MRTSNYLAFAAAALLVAGAAASASAADATENWNKMCASCHAKDGSGSTVMGKKNGVKDYRDAAVQAKLTDAEAMEAINEGVKEHGKDRMKSFKDKLTPEEIKALVAHLRKFKK